MKNNYPEIVSIKYLVYYYFCKSEINETRILSPNIDQSNLEEALLDGSAAYFS